jgi:diguanylate cyclase (GGDEF)-like protein
MIGFSAYTTHSTYHSILNIKNDASVVNQLGVIRGLIQRNTKLIVGSLYSEANHVEGNIDKQFLKFKEGALLAEASGNGPIQESLDVLAVEWNSLKLLYKELEKNNKNQTLITQVIQLSEDCWDIADRIVYQAEATSKERMSYVKKSYWLMMLNVLNIIVLLIAVYFYIKFKLEDYSFKDALTGLNNRRSYDLNIENEFYRAKRYQLPLCLILIDIDFFKKINDQHGHDVGDSVIRHLASIMLHICRRTDFVYRIGGEEFAMLATHTSIDKALDLAEKIRVYVENDSFHKDIKVTVSLGISELHANNDIKEFFTSADKALYMAKSQGRNKVCTI